jgi:hypothetical protein
MITILSADIIGGGVVALVIGLAVAALLIDRHRDPIGLHAGTDDVEEHLKPLRSGSAKVGRRISAEFRSKGLMLPNRASAAGRKLATALDKSRPAGRLRRLAAAARALTRALVMGPALLIPGKQRRAARQAAPKGKHRAAPDARPAGEIPEVPSVLLAAPPEVAHADPDTARYGWDYEDGPCPAEPEDLHDVLRAGLAEAERGETVTHDLEDPDDLVDVTATQAGSTGDGTFLRVKVLRGAAPVASQTEWVGDLGPAEQPEPERAPRRQPGRFFPGIAAFHVLPVVAGALVMAAKAKVTVYPDWPTGNLPIVVAELGAAR